MEEMVRMGEMAVSDKRGEVLAAVGLGSCVGLALIDGLACVAGLAHVVLPESQGAPGPPAKFADLAVPALVAAMEGRGAARRRLEAVLVGGAQMFTPGASADIGARNLAAVRAELETAGIPIHAEKVGGSRGRTARIVVGHHVSSQLAGGRSATLLQFRGRRAITTGRHG